MRHLDSPPRSQLNITIIRIKPHLIWFFAPKKPLAYIYIALKQDFTPRQSLYIFIQQEQILHF